MSRLVKCKYKLVKRVKRVLQKMNYTLQPVLLYKNMWQLQYQSITSVCSTQNVYFKLTFVY